MGKTKGVHTHITYTLSKITDITESIADSIQNNAIYKLFSKREKKSYRCVFFFSLYFWWDFSFVIALNNGWLVDRLKACGGSAGITSPTGCTDSRKNSTLRPCHLVHLI